MEPDDFEYEILKNEILFISKQKEIKTREESGTAIFDFYVTLQEQRDMLSLGFVGDFINTVFPCDRTKKPFISIDEHCERNFNDGDHVQCPLFGERCDLISRENEEGALPCGLIYKKLERTLY